MSEAPKSSTPLPSDEPPLAAIVDELQSRLAEALDVIEALADYSRAGTMDEDEGEREVLDRAERFLAQNHGAES